jgi:hypothetical protein
MKLSLEMETGNAAVQTRHDIADVLRHVANRIDDELAPWFVHAIRDINGDNFGKFELTGLDVAEWEDAVRQQGSRRGTPLRPPRVFSPQLRSASTHSR